MSQPQKTGVKALEIIKKKDPSIILLDVKLPDMDGLDILRQLKKSGSKAKIIVITAHGSVATAVNAMREGATDFLLKPFNAERLLTTVRNAQEIQRLSSLVEKYEQKHERDYSKFIGKSSAMRAVYRMIDDAAPSKASVFILGESGTGKELCAQAIHENSPRNASRFIALNCAAIPANLMESEIFGHVKGAFTGAIANRDGAAVKADGGTIFLDEICEMNLELQAKLLRFIQTGQIVPVGSNEPRTVNVRFVCATNRNPWVEVEEGRFRQDLLYRLHVIPIHMPPLRDRGSDILHIATGMLSDFAAEEEKEFTALSSDAEDTLLSHSWPGNVRELANVIQSAVVLNRGTTMTGEMLQRLLGPSHRKNAIHTPDVFHPPQQSQIPVAGTDTRIVPLAIAERQIIEAAIDKCGGRVGKAARLLEVNPSTLYRKLKTWGK